MQNKKFRHEKKYIILDRFPICFLFRKLHTKVGYQGQILHRESGEVLEQAVQRGCGCAVLRGVQARLDGALSNLVWY